jgi:glyoxylase-like metal-dependent hydrolase (beta-lactamase superfamily II)
MRFGREHTVRAAVACGVAMIVLSAAGTAPAQRDLSKVEMKTTKVAGNVYMLEGAGGNIGVSAGPDGILIVDDQFAPLADKIREALKGIGNHKLRFILNTHWHGDHTGSNAVFGPEATIIAQTNVRRRLEGGGVVVGNKVDPVTKEALPVITFDESLSIYLNGEEIKAMHVPSGHTDGDSVIYFTGSNVVHMGDQFFNGMFPFIDLDSGGSVDGYVKNVATVIEKLPAGAKIIPGHGPLATIDDLKMFHRMLVETIGFVQKRMHDGKTPEQIKAEGLPAEWKPYGNGFINEGDWIDFIVKSHGMAHKH